MQTLRSQVQFEVGAWQLHATFRALATYYVLNPCAAVLQATDDVANWTPLTTPAT
jgi:hypothetical protein